MLKYCVLVAAVCLSSCASVYSVHISGYKFTVAGAIELTKEPQPSSEEYAESHYSFYKE